MDVTYAFQWNPKVYKGLQVIPDRILYQVAKETLDRSVPSIPMRSGDMRKTSIAGGVRGSSQDFYIGSFTNYASHVWKMNNVKWTIPGTNGQWYARTLKQYGTSIIDSAINKSWREVM